jgi:trk system potassium uptake protein TrkA
VKIVIVGCGRVGAGLAERMAREGHQVTVVDISSESFGRLEQDFPGQALRGDGTDEDVLRRAGIDGADMFFALTEGDNRNVLAAQLANETFGVERVVAKVNDPVRAEAYTLLGLATICRTRMMVDALARHAGMKADPGATGVQAATGGHAHGARSQSSGETVGAGAPTVVGSEV